MSRTLNEAGHTAMTETRPGIYVTREVHRKIKVLAAERGISIRELAEQLIEEELRRGTHDATTTNKSEPGGPGPKGRKKR
jgi:hypothetical protein